MPLRHHVILLIQAIVVWALFWLAGWPDYFQQYSPVFLGVGSVLLSVGFSLIALAVLLPRTPERRRQRAFWIALYFTVPFAILDTLYCGVHLGHGAGYLYSFWYLSVFYLTPWLTFPPTAWLLNRAASR